MTDTFTPTYNLHSWQRHLNGPNMQHTPEARLKETLAACRQSVTHILEMREQAVRRELDRRSVRTPLSWLLASFTNPFNPSDTTTDARHEEAAQIRNELMQTEGIVGGRLMEKNPDTPFEKQRNRFYVDQSGDVIWIMHNPAEASGEALVSRYQVLDQIFKVQSSQKLNSQDLPASVSRSMMSLDELEHLSHYLGTLCLKLHKMYQEINVPTDKASLRERIHRWLSSTHTVSV